MVRPGREAIICIALAVCLSVCVFLANSPVKVPTIQGDEGSHIANAAAIAGFENDMFSSYHAGYSFLIAPAFWLSDSPLTIWTAVKAVNAFLYFMTVVVLWLLARRLAPGLGMTSRLGAVALVSLYPMWVIMVGYSFSQIAFVPVFLLAVLAFLRAAEGGTMSWLCTGICAGFLYWVHPVGGGVALAAVAAGGYLAWRKRSYWGFVALLIGSVAMILFYEHAVTPWLYDRMTISGLTPRLHYPTLVRMLSRFVSSEELQEMIAHAGGHLLLLIAATAGLAWSGLLGIGLVLFGGLKEAVAYGGGHLLYLSIGTVGLLWVGLLSLVRKVIRKPDGEDNDSEITSRATAVFVLLSFVAILCLSVLFHSTGPGLQRLDTYIYGRYVEGVIAPILLVGALAASFRKALWAIPVSLLGAALVLTTLDTYHPISYQNIAAFWQVFPLAGHGMWVWVAVGCGPIILAAVAPRRVAMLLIAAAFVYASVLQIGAHVESSSHAMTRCEVAFTVREEYPPGTRIGFDRPGFYGPAGRRWEYWYDFAFVLFDYRLHRMSVEQWVEQCDGPLFSYDRYLDVQGIDAYPLVVSPHGDLVLWEKGPAPPGHIDHRNALVVSRLLERGMRSDAGELRGGSLFSTGEQGFLLFGPYAMMDAGNYTIVVKGAASLTKSAWVDVVSEQSTVRHAIYALTTTDGEIGVLASGWLWLDTDVIDLEVRVHVGAEDEIRLDGYELVPYDGTKEIALRVSHFARWDVRSRVGALIDGSLISTGHEGFLAFGPYIPMPGGEYTLVVTGSATSTESAWVDVVSERGEVQHAKLPLTPTERGEVGVLASGQVYLDRNVADIEVRVYVGADDEVRLDGYDLVLIDGNPLPAAGG